MGDAIENRSGAGSKLPGVGTTIFTVVSRRAQELGAVNLGQGFPDYDIDPRLTELVYAAMREGYNQYAPMSGMPELRAAIAAKCMRDYGIDCDTEHEITITLGASEAIFSAIQALVGRDEEVVVLDPAYDAYEPAVLLAGGRCVHVPLESPTFRVDWQRVRAALTDRTRLLILNSPHNPGCSCLSAQDLATLDALLRDRPVTVLADEVYEHVVFDGARHHSVLSHPALRARSIAVFSFGKTLHATGLRVGYAVAPPALTAELRKVHQFNCFTIATSLQVAIARYLRERADYGRDLPAFFQGKRDRLIAALAGTPFVLPPAAGSFFQLLDYGALSREPDTVFAERLLTEAGVATIPLSVFYQRPPPLTLLRLCIAKRDATLDVGAERLRAFAARFSTTTTRTAP